MSWCIIHSDGRHTDAPQQIWSCFWGALIRCSCGWSQRSVCAGRSANGYSYSRSSSRLPPSEFFSTHIQIEQNFEKKLMYSIFEKHITCVCCAFIPSAVESLRIWTLSSPLSWACATQPWADSARHGRLVPYCTNESIWKHICHNLRKVIFIVWLVLYFVFIPKSPPVVNNFSP